jgi:hypothetical protein
MTSMHRLAGVAAALLLLAPGAAKAGGDKAGRYTMSPTEGGFARLDTETGEMSLCKRDGDGEWACEAMPDRQQALRREMEKLERENRELREERDQDRGSADGPPGESPPPGDGPSGKIPIPTEQDVDKLFDYVEGMMKKLKERLKRLEEQNRESTPL